MDRMLVRAHSFGRASRDLTTLCQDGDGSRFKDEEEHGPPRGCRRRAEEDPRGGAKHSRGARRSSVVPAGVNGIVVLYASCCCDTCAVPEVTTWRLMDAQRRTAAHSYPAADLEGATYNGGSLQPAQMTLEQIASVPGQTRLTHFFHPLAR